MPRSGARPGARCVVVWCRRSYGRRVPAPPVDVQTAIALPTPAVVVLVGPSGCGKTTWARSRFAANEIVSSDTLRAVVGSGESDLDASDDAFAVLDAVVAA